RHLSLQRFRNPAPPSLVGVPLGWFPRFHGTTRRSDFRRSIPPRFVAFAWPYCSLLAVCSSSPASVASRPGLDIRVPIPDQRAEIGGSPRFLGDPWYACRVLRPRRGRRVRPSRRDDVAFRQSYAVGPHD